MPVVFQYSAKTNRNGKSPVPAAALMLACSPLLLCLPNLTLQKMSIIFKLLGVLKGKQQDAYLYLVLHNVYLPPLLGFLSFLL